MSRAPGGTGVSTPAGAVDPTLPYTPGGAGDVTAAGHYGRFEVLGSLGAGGMGVVLVARDPDLDRRVALKILRPDSLRDAQDGATRLAREAQAMAKLAHPNVVTVHEVGRVGAVVFIAMELIEGTTLRGWLDARVRPWREVVAMFVAAGRGLAAAHAAGMVHRDFKPDNVLIGRDGRPRVTDFGLVTDEPREPSTAAGEAEAGTASPQLTTRGTTVGTPAYMPAEQWNGAPTDARSDQFAFCVALWEALHGARPFAGSDSEQIRAAVLAGRVAPPPAQRRRPRGIDAVLRRGLAMDPAARWPDMDSLLAALERLAGARRRWKIAAAAAGGAAVAVVATIAVIAMRDDPGPCAPPTERIAAVWNAKRRDALTARLVVVDPAQGASRGALAANTFDRSARAWGEMHVAACRATRIDGRQSDTLLDRRIECLDRAMRELAETVALVEEAGDPAAIDEALRAVMTLPSLDECADVRALDDRLPPPTDRAQRAEADAIDVELTGLEVAQRAGRVAEIVAPVQAIVERARRLGYSPILARALWLLSNVDTAHRDDEALRTVLDELTHVAATARDDRLAALAWIHLVGAVGENLGRPDDAEQLLPAMVAAVARAGDPPDLRFDRLETEAQIWKVRRDPARALALMEEAVRVIEAAGARTPGSPLAGRLAAAAFQTGNIQGVARDWEAAAAAYRTALDLRVALFGPDHPDVANAYVVLGEALRQIGKADDAIAAYAEAARIGEARLAPSPMLALIIGRVGAIQSEIGQPALAIAPLERALAMGRETMSADDTRLADLTTDLGTAFTGLHRYDEARARFADALAIYDRRAAKDPTINWAVVLFNAADVEVQAGNCAGARPLLDRALAMFEAIGGKESGFVTYPLNHLARCHLARRRWNDAFAAIARVQATKVGDPAPGLAARFLHGRALVESRRDATRGLAEVKAARADIARPDSGASPDLLAEVDRWLAGR